MCVCAHPRVSLGFIICGPGHKGSVNEPQTLLLLQKKRKKQRGLHGNESISCFLTWLQMDRKQISISSFNPRMRFIS